MKKKGGRLIGRGLPFGRIRYMVKIMEDQVDFIVGSFKNSRLLLRANAIKCYGRCQEHVGRGFDGWDHDDGDDSGDDVDHALEFHRVSFSPLPLTPTMAIATAAASQTSSSLFS